VKPLHRHWSKIPFVKTSHFEIRDGAVSLGNAKEMGDEGLAALTEALKDLMPWRKGPWNFFGIDVDAEWVSSRKWERVAPMLPDLTVKRICDVGCNNGYYMYRMLKMNPDLVYGIDPMVRYYFNIRLANEFLHDSRIKFDLFGAEQLPVFPHFFDCIFYMGILYHRRDPLGSLEQVASALKPGGTLILETAGIPGEDPVCLFPEGRYLKAPGYWFMPTASAVNNMLKRTGFTDIELFNSHKLEAEEQRRTDWAVFQSLEDFLDPEKPDRTVEGYPAPHRFYFRAVKK